MHSHKKNTPYLVCEKNNRLETEKIQAESEIIDPIKTKIIKIQGLCVLCDFNPLVNKTNNVTDFTIKEKIELNRIK